MNHLQLATNTLCVDEPNYEKALKTFSQYCNFQRFKERVVSGQSLQVLKGGRQEERIRQIVTRPSYWSNFGWKRKRADVELFKKII